jgi:hypothetical protein
MPYLILAKKTNIHYDVLIIHDEREIDVTEA